MALIQSDCVFKEEMWTYRETPGIHPYREKSSLAPIAWEDRTHPLWLGAETLGLWHSSSLPKVCPLFCTFSTQRLLAVSRPRSGCARILRHLCPSRTRGYKKSSGDSLIRSHLTKKWHNTCLDHSLDNISIAYCQRVPWVGSPGVAVYAAAESGKGRVACWLSSSHLTN